MTRLIVALATIALAICLAAGVGAGASTPPPASTAAAGKPTIHKMLIPYPKKRKREMASYSKRHYGQYKWRLNNPKLIVEHYAAAGSISAIYNTFAPDRPDVEFHQRVRQGYLALARSEPSRWLVTDGTTSIEILAARIDVAVRTLISSD